MRQQTAERDLIGRMRARDGNAVAELAATYGPRIQQLAFRYVKNHEDAEEVAQDVLLKVYRKIDAFRGDAALSSWIYRITFNTAMSRLRTARLNRRERSKHIPIARRPFAEHTHGRLIAYHAAVPDLDSRRSGSDLLWKSESQEFA